MTGTRTVSSGHMYLNVWSPVGALWENYENSRRKSLVRESSSLGSGFGFS